MTDKTKPPAAATGRGQTKKADNDCPNYTPNLPKATGRIIAPGQPYKVGAVVYPANTTRWQFIARCPFCGKEHLHGWTPNPAELIPTRLAHCGRGEYFIGEVMT